MTSKPGLWPDYNASRRFFGVRLLFALQDAVFKNSKNE